MTESVAMSPDPSNGGFPVEGRVLPFDLPDHFERFYRAQLRRLTGSRLRSLEVQARYAAWAAASGAPSVSLSLQRDCLEAIGHRRLHSDGIHYADLGWADDHVGVADTLTLPLRGRPARQGRQEARETSALLVKVDEALASLLALRSAIERSRDRLPPHVIAQMTLGLGDR